MTDVHGTIEARRAWRFASPKAAFQPSLAEVNATVKRAARRPWLRRLLAFAGPGYMISVGYMDPGNWATDLAGGAQFGYTLLSVILISNLMAILLQALAAQARHRHRARPRPGLPRPLPAGRQFRTVDRLRAGDHRLRPGRGDRHGHRAAAAFRHSADRRRGHHRAGRVLAVAFDEQGIPLPRSLRDHAAGGHRRLLRGGDRGRGAAVRRGAFRFRADARDRHQQGDALHRHRHYRRHGDAAQSLPALFHRADARL